MDIDFIHAHTFFSDGGVAYILNKKFNIPYIIAVRNTDINTFLKYKKYLKYFGKFIIKNANQIIFLSESYKNMFLSIMPNDIQHEIENKSLIIPNGIDDYWIENHKDNFKNFQNNISLLFIGAIDRNKNLKFNIQVCNQLLKEGYQCALHIVGDGPELESCKNLVEKLGISSKVFFYGKITDKYKLNTIMEQCNLFLLNSKFETFGLVYAEAISQGLKVIYTRDQGFDKQFEEGIVGYSIEYNNFTECLCKIQKLIVNQKNSESSNIGFLISKFNWNNIAKQYKHIYILKNGGDENII